MPPVRYESVGLARQVCRPRIIRNARRSAPCDDKTGPDRLPGTKRLGWTHDPTCRLLYQAAHEARFCGLFPWRKRQRSAAYQCCPGRYTPLELTTVTRRGLLAGREVGIPDAACARRRHVPFRNLRSRVGSVSGRRRVDTAVSRTTAQG
jgi:hypothetical protein